MTSSNEIAMLNIALDLALEWGEDWLEPVQSRLTKHYPQLSAEELDIYNDTVQKVMRFGWEAIEGLDFMNASKAAFEQFKGKVLQTYPWITEKNLSHMFSQSCYYALK